MPSKLSIHMSAYPDKCFDVLERMQPSVIKVFNQSSEMNLDELKRRVGAPVIYRQYTELDYHNSSADMYFAEVQNVLGKLRGRGIYWEGLNEPVLHTIEDAQALNAWFVRFAEIWHAQGELVAGFSWSTGNPTPQTLAQFIPYLIPAAAACDLHAFHEYYSMWGKDQDWGLYRAFERALPAYARKPVVITEAGIDDNSQPATGGWRGKISPQQYVDIMKQYDALLLSDPYVLGATLYEWGDGSWPSFELTPIIQPLADYVVAAGRGAIIPRPFPVPLFAPSQSFTATPDSIKPGQKATLAWAIDNATTITLDGTPVTASGTLSVTPAQTTTYTLHLVLSDHTTKDLTVTVTVIGSTTPLITDSQFEPIQVSAGQLLTVSITVRNDSTETLQTQDPAPGFVYDEGDTFYTRKFPDVANAFRVAVDFEGRIGVDHPFRWGLPAPLAPGQATTITGAIRLKTPRIIKYWAGLVRERVAWLQDHVGTQQITVTTAPVGAPFIAQSTFTPTTLTANDLLTVSIVVQNNSTETLPTQDPAPGFIYDEGDTFVTRGFKDQARAVRIGIDFDGRIGMDHPYRWGLGVPLAPGQATTITGAIRLKTPRAINYWAGLVREQVAWLQDHIGAQNITVTAAPVGVATLTQVTFTPTTVVSGALLNVSIVVQNNSSATLPTQDPAPGFVYDEGDTFYTRGWREFAGNFRVGVDFTGRSGVDHPYRWGLGAPLAPGQSATITGAIRLTSLQSVEYWAGLVNERTAWLQDRVGIQKISVIIPPPIVTFNATPATIPAGSSATLAWSATNVQTATLDHQPVAATGSQNVTPTQTTTYTLHLVFLDGSTQDAAVTVTVTPPPVTVSFTATPTAIVAGQSATLAWQTQGANQVLLDGAVVAANDTRAVSPATTTTYTLRLVLPDNTTQDTTATTTVSAPVPQPTRPPTVTLTMENLARLKTFPRPANDNGRGLHFNIDLRDETIQRTVGHLVSIGCKWTLIFAPDENQAARSAKACWDAGIMPIVRIGRKVDESFDPILFLNALKAQNIPPYVQIFNEPGDNREWKSGQTPANWMSVFAGKWAQNAAAIYDAGGYPGIQVLGREELVAAVNAVRAINRMEIFERAVFILHNYGANHPPAYPYDARNQQDNPGATIFDDDVAALCLLEYAQWMQDSIGYVLPIIGGEGGWEFGAENDRRYPKAEQPYHAHFHADVFDWFRTGIVANGEPLPDYLFSITPWIEGGWGMDDWWGGGGDKTETINAVSALPPFVRQFSWDKGELYFNILPHAISVGESATLEWRAENAATVTLDGTSVSVSGTRVITPTQTTIYTLHVVFPDGTCKDLMTRIVVLQVVPPEWDPRLDPLGVKLTRDKTPSAWRLVAAKYQDPNESNNDHDVFFTMLNANGTPAAGVRCVVDWINRDPQDTPAVVVTDAQGQARSALWAILHPDKKDGPYFVYVKDVPCDQVSGMGLPMNYHVNYLLTFKRG